MSLKKLRELLSVSGGSLPLDTEKAIVEIEQTQRENASYIDHLEIRLKTELEKQGDSQDTHPSVFRKEWEQSNGKSQGSHVESFRFDEPTGTYIDTNSPFRYCAACYHAYNRKTPLRNDEHGWNCMVCNKFFPDPTRPYPGTEPWQPLDPVVGL